MNEQCVCEEYTPPEEANCWIEGGHNTKCAGDVLKCEHETALKEKYEEISSTIVTNMRKELKELKEFVRTITLDLQNHRYKSIGQLDDMFQKAYRLYVKYKVEEAE